MTTTNELTGWVQVTCAESETILNNTPNLTVAISDQNTGFKEWADATSTPVLRDYRHSDKDYDCSHYAPAN